jgi:hypothetical protein
VLRSVALLACVHAFVFSPSPHAAEPAATATPSLAPAARPRATGTPFLRTWTAEDYGASPGNRCIVQHPQNHFIYVGNNAGVLEFDGTRWRLIRVPGRPTVRTLAVDALGYVWTANDDMICRVAADARGELTAVPMRDRLPPEARDFRSAFASLATPTGVYFTAARHLLFFPHDDTPARAWALPEESTATRLWWSDDAPHWQLANRKIFCLRADRIEPAAPATPIAPSDADETLDTVLLPDGRLAVATARTGLLLHDRTGRLDQRIDRSTGLPSNRIDALCADHEGGVWLALRNGLARVQLDSPYALHGTAQGLDGAPIGIGLDGDHLYVASGEGLMRRDPAGRFHSLGPDLAGPRKMLSDAGRLFIAGANLQFAPAGAPLRVVDERPHHGFLPLRTAPGLFVFGTPNGLSFGRVDRATWRRLGRCADPTGPIHAVLEHPAGIVWALSPAGKLWRVDFTAGARATAPARAFTTADGLPAGFNEVNTRLVPLGDSLVVLSRGKLFRFDPASSRFVPESRIIGLPAAAPTSDAATIALAGSGPNGSLWLQLPAPTRTTFHVVPDGPDRWRATPLTAPALPRYAPTDLLHDPAAHTLWLAGPAALVSLDLDWQPARPPPALSAYLRHVETSAGSAVWRDGQNLTASATAPLRLDYRQNALRVTYAAPTFPADFRGRTHTFFRTKLDGLDQTWSTWSQTAQREFTNLPYRDFTLRLQARDDTGRVSAETVLAFSIAPPWWLTRWAYLAYAALGLLTLGQIIRLRTRVLQRKAAYLETVVAARTAELHGQNHELARLHRLELDEKISARLAEEKARLEVLRYQLNPHFLFNALNSVCAQITRSPTAARSMVVRLADFCRLTLHRPDATEAAMSVAEELAVLRAYLEIEQARLGELLTVEVSSDLAADSFRLPPFLLLPLVENAVKYGTRTSVERLTVRLHVRCEPGGAISVEVANTGTWLEPGSHSAPSHGIGLENLRQRLTRYFPSSHEFITVSSDGWVIMRLRLLAPLRD